MKSDPREWIDERIEQTAELRRRDVGYAGLAGPFRAIEEKLRADFKLSGHVQHPGDKGTARENVLRNFLAIDGYLPRRFALAAASSHVLSTTGHVSAQIDLLFYDALNTPLLLAAGGIQYFPIESCFGMIESKSDLTSRAVIVDGLDKIAEFKRLRTRCGENEAPSRGFGVLFGYTASLKWETVFEAVREWESAHEPQLWPNLVVILDKGVIGHVHARRGLLHTDEIASNGGELSALAMRTDVLLGFYLMLMDVLADIEPFAPPLRSYAWLPRTEGEHSYEFVHAFSEMRVCKKHGQFLRRMSPESIARVIAACPPGSELDGGEQLARAYGGGTDAGDWGQVFVYNPDNHGPERLLIRPSRMTHNGTVHRVLGLSFEPVHIDRRHYWLPEYYVLRDGLISGCPKCGTEPVLARMSLDDFWKSLERDSDEPEEGPDGRDEADK